MVFQNLFFNRKSKDEEGILIFLKMKLIQLMETFIGFVPVEVTPWEILGIIMPVLLAIIGAVVMQESQLLTNKKL
jgi:hypothetical protein